MARLLLLRCLTLVILPSVVRGDVPPPRCRTTDSTDRPYECLLCGAADDAALREGVTYRSTATARSTRSSPVVLPIRSRSPTRCTFSRWTIGHPPWALVVTGTDVRIRDVFVSDTIVVRGKDVTGLQLTNITTTDDDCSVEPTSVHHDIDITGLTALQLQTTAAVEAISADLQPVATFFHSFGDMTLICADQQTVIGEIPSGIATLAGCDVISHPGRVRQRLYVRRVRHPRTRVGRNRPQLGNTLTAVSAGLILLTRNPRPPRPMRRLPHPQPTA